jgi:hypothetical protein
MAASPKFTNTPLLTISGVCFVLGLICYHYAEPARSGAPSNSLPQVIQPQAIPARVASKPNSSPRMTPTLPPPPLLSLSPASGRPTPKPTPQATPNNHQREPTAQQPSETYNSPPRTTGRAVNPLNAAQCEQRIDSYFSDPNFFTIPPECMNQFRARQQRGRP